MVFGPVPTNIALANSFIIINGGGGPTDDKPTVTLATPSDPDRVSSFLNIRVADIHAVYAEWSARGAQFLTPPKQHQYEIRCYIRDPDGYIMRSGRPPTRRETGGPPAGHRSTPADNPTDPTSLEVTTPAIAPDPDTGASGVPVSAGRAGPDRLATPSPGRPTTSSRDRSSDEIDLVDHTSAPSASDADEYAFVQPVEAVGPGLDFDCSAEDVFTCVDVFSASETLEDRRASVPHTLRLDVEHISAFGLQRVADVAERGAIGKNDLPIGARSRKQCPPQLRSAEGPAGQRNDAPVTSGDRADILGVADRRFQAVDQVQAWIGKASVHGFSPGLVSVATK